MILFLANGRFGNQIFQYAFLKTIQKNNESLIISGFEELKEVFKISDFIALNKKNWLIRNFLFRILNPILYFLSKKKVISSVFVNRKIINHNSRECSSYSRKTGVFKNITFVKLGYFQSEIFFKKNIPKLLKIKGKYLNRADEYLRKIPKDSYKIFVHVRRGDYKNYAILGKSTLVPMSYFINQMKWFLKYKEKSFFIIISDDPHFVKAEFTDFQNTMIISENNYCIDFTIMTKCMSAILSPSSYSWWGAYLMNNRDIVFTPKYWLGFNSNVEYPQGVTLSFAREIRV